MNAQTCCTKWLICVLKSVFFQTLSLSFLFQNIISVWIAAHRPLLQTLQKRNEHCFLSEEYYNTFPFCVAIKKVHILGECCHFSPSKRQRAAEGWEQPQIIEHSRVDTDSYLLLEASIVDTWLVLLPNKFSQGLYSPADNRHNFGEPGFAVYTKCFDCFW